MNVGDYVRTTGGDIGIIINCPEQLKKEYGNWLWFETTNEQRPIGNENIIKSSPNIIDLIEVGDVYKKTYPTGLVEIIPINKLEDLYNIKNDIKNGFKLSIITKEQIESMEYKVGE